MRDRKRKNYEKIEESEKRMNTNQGKIFKEIRIQKKIEENLDYLEHSFIVDLKYKTSNKKEMSTNKLKMFFEKEYAELKIKRIIWINEDLIVLDQRNQLDREKLRELESKEVEMEECSLKFSSSLERKRGLLESHYSKFEFIEKETYHNVLDDQLTTEQKEEWQKLFELEICKKLNPPIEIQSYLNNKNATIHVIRDDKLIGGSKQRGLIAFLQLPQLENIQEFCYAGIKKKFNT